MSQDNQDPNLIYQSSKTYTHAHGYSCCFRQWRADSHCSKLHGYALQVELVFEGEIDDRNWVQDFGGLKDVKMFLDNTFDHKLIIALDDPDSSALDLLSVRGLADIVYMPAVGCEKFAEYIYGWVSERHRKLKSVKVSEHPGNSATVIRKDS